MNHDAYAGFQVVAACLPAGRHTDTESLRALLAMGVPVLGGIDDILAVVRREDADAVAVTASAEIGPERLRWISWQLEGTKTDLMCRTGPDRGGRQRACTSGRCPGCRCCRSKRRSSAASTGCSRVASTASSAAQRAACAVAATDRRRGADPDDQPRARAVPPDPRRARRHDVHDLEVPLDVRRRRSVARQRSPERNDARRRPAVQDARRSTRHPGRAPRCAGSPWTSCRSW